MLKVTSCFITINVKHNNFINGYPKRIELLEKVIVRDSCIHILVPICFRFEMRVFHARFCMHWICILNICCQWFYQVMFYFLRWWVNVINSIEYKVVTLYLSYLKIIKYKPCFIVQINFNLHGKDANKKDTV